MNIILKTVLFLTLTCVFGADEDGVKRESVSVMKGDSVTLDTHLREKFHRIQWRFGGSFVAEIYINKISYTDDERFRDRLKLNNQTGSLTINNTRITDSGLYKLELNHNTGVSYKTFSVTVNESGLSPGAVAGAVVGVLLLVLSAAAVFYYRHRICDPKCLVG